MTEAGVDLCGEPAAPARYLLRLYVTGATARSVRAIENLRRFCEGELAGFYELEVIDIYQNPEAARDAQVIAAPTLVKVQPEPVRRIIGDLGDKERMRRGLNIGDAGPPRAGEVD